MTKHITLVGGHLGKLAPVQEKRLARMIRPSTKWVAEWAGDNSRMSFQVRKANEDETLSVDLVKHTCSCNKWQLTGNNWPIGRPKLHNRRKDLVEDLVEGGKLKKSFRVTCAKCGEKGHNYKTCKGAPANPNWKSKTRRNKKGAATSSSTPSQQAEVNQAGPTMVVLQPQPRTRKAKIPFKPPTQIANGAGSSRQFRAKQPIRRQKRSSPPPSEPPTLSQETLAAASASTQKKFRFMQTPGLNSKQQ
ncbi:hypothetical protein PIB30_016488 [Stylosanthes scabra]|uniref:CCHC-type domain-containing protein n=1 Tax=Stylosanthes scabra TaxID=79078 RepID=A0ABU6Y7Z4_9FABA|nr:hypothetical protein [Stylosanthes scabra]